MPPSTKSPEPPSFYNKLAGMPPSPAPPAAANAGGAPSSPGGAGEKQELALKFFQLAEKWAKTGKDVEPYATRVMDTIKEFWTTVLKKDAKELATGGAGGADAGAGAPPPAAGAAPPPTGGDTGTMPVPA